ncbi:Endophilin-A2 [Balamuthia mandrillaris]
MATKHATDKVVEEISPSSDSKNPVTGLFAGESKKTKEEKAGEAFVKLGAKLKEVDERGSPFGEGIVSLGSTLLQVGAEHQQLNRQLLEKAVGPMRQFQTDTLKNVSHLQKKYEEHRLEYDSAKRANDKKSSPKTQQEQDRAKEAFEASKNSYYEAMLRVQDSEADQVKQLAAYAECYAEYYRACSRLFETVAKELDSLAQQAASSPSSSSHYPSNTYSSGGDGYPSPPSSSASASYMSQPSASPHPTYPSPSSSTPSPYSYQGAPAAPSTTTPSPRGPPPTPPPRAAAAPSVQTCTALYDFQGQSDQELSFRQGDVIMVLKQVNQDWHEGALQGRVGIFPTSYVQLN